MYTIGLTDATINDVLHVLAGILMIGNIEFVSTGGAQVRDKSGKLMKNPLALNLLKIGICIATFSVKNEFWNSYS